MSAMDNCNVSALIPARKSSNGDSCVHRMLTQTPQFARNLKRIAQGFRESLSEKSREGTLQPAGESRNLTTHGSLCGGECRAIRQRACLQCARPENFLAALAARRRMRFARRGLPMNGRRSYPREAFRKEMRRSYSI
jgi:hypothetical protein